MQKQKIGVWVFSILLLGILIQGGMPSSYAGHLKYLDDRCKAENSTTIYSAELEECVYIPPPPPPELGDVFREITEDEGMGEREKEIIESNLATMEGAQTQQVVMDEEINSAQSGGGCLIATATYGSELAPQVQMLRELRDNVILKTESGAAFMSGFNQMYYSFSPTVADMERENPVLREVIKVTITPMISSLSILNHLDIDSEAEMLGYGIGIISLNIGMYIFAPVIVIMKLFNRKK